MSAYLQDRLPPVANPDPSMWIDEAIWGHRYHDEQNPWLTFLEFLNIFVHEDAKGRAFEEPSGFNTLRYKPARRLHLRNLLFNNPKIEMVLNQGLPEEHAWNMWAAKMQDAQGINDPSFDYLKHRFHAFRDFAKVLSLLRSTSLELNTNKRWSSKFVFPYGVDCLYEDLNKTAKTNDRNFFGRTGELLYLMHCRAACRDKVLHLLKENMVMQNSPWNRIAKALQPQEDELSGAELGKSFLPYPKHPTYDALANDWVTLLSLGMPGYDALPYIVNLAAFHLVQYQLRVARDVAGITAPFRIVCEVVAPKKTLVREISCDLYQQNNLLTHQAITAYIDAIEKSGEWQFARTQPGAFVRCKNILMKTVLWPMSEGDYEGANNPGDLINELRAAAKKRHQQHVANVHRNYGRDIGLVSKRGTVKLRYAPNDDLLKALLYANVNKRMELNQFLSLLWDRYALIFGDREAEQILAKDEFDKKSFQANARRLEQRLASLGLLKRLSDGCAYVLNPYARNKA
jgi:hypothetical protein